MKTLNTILFLVVLIVAYGATHILFSQTPKTPLNQISNFSFTDINAHTHTLNDFKSKPIIINFWATWCAPCVKEFPILLDLARDNKDITFIALSSDIDEDTIQKFLARQAYKDMPANIYIALDRDNITGTIFKTHKLPETLIINKQGTLHHKFIGADWTKNQAQNILDSL